MSQQDKQEINNHESLIEDLTVNQEQEEEVKGGTLGDGSVRFVKDSVSLQTW